MLRTGFFVRGKTGSEYERRTRREIDNRGEEQKAGRREREANKGGKSR